MSAVVLSHVASALFDLILGGVWFAAVRRLLEQQADGVAFPRWLWPSAVLAAALLLGSAIAGLAGSDAVSLSLRLAAALAMLAGVIGLGRSYRRLPFKAGRSGGTAGPGPSHSNSPDASGQSSEAAAADDAKASSAQLQTLRLFEAALEGSSITISRQGGPDLRYTRIYNPLPGLPASLGRTDEDILPAEAQDEVRALKLEVLRTGEPVDTEIHVPFEEKGRWFKLRLERAEDGDDKGLICVAVDITSEKESEQQLRSLLRELTHRSRNLLAVIQGIARRTAAASDDVDSFVDRFGGRLQALAAAHDILIDSAWRGASLRELVQVQLAHIGASGQEQLVVEGEPLTLKPEAAQHLSLALHELAANAVAHGALSTPGGQVRLSWAASEPPDHPADGIEMVWREAGGPPVGAPRRSGFGQIVLDRLVPRGLDGEATLEFLPEGVVWRLNFPRSNLLETRPAA